MFLAEQYTGTSCQVFGEEMRTAYHKHVSVHDGDLIYVYTGCLG
jgi:hypothetical protein